MEQVISLTILLTALACGLVAGAFFIFSVAVMPALRRRPAAEGMAAMQAINIVILNPLFLGVFIGAAALSAVLAFFSIFYWAEKGSARLLAGAIAYLGGSFIVTIAFNVPLNNLLAAADPSTDSGHAIWSNYQRVWTFWNSLRAAASLIATAFLVLAHSAR